MRKTLFLLPTADPSAGRNFIHISKWRERGHYVEVAGFLRPEAGESREIDHVLGEIRHGDYLNRLPAYLGSILKLAKLLRQFDSVVVYTLDSFVLLGVAHLIARTKMDIVLFVLDIRDLAVKKGLKGSVVRWLFRYSIRRSDVVAVSSAAFVEQYFRKYLDIQPARWLEIENKVAKHPEYRSQQLEAPVDPSGGRITIGYFGVMRCARSIELLKALAEKYPEKYRVVTYGRYLVAEQVLVQAFIDLPNVDYFGAYDGAAGLEKVYSSCDIVWACYPYSSSREGNHLWAKTNRFYESLYYGKPVIVSAGTQDAVAVEALGAGLTVDMSELESCVEALDDALQSRLEEWRQKVAKIPAEKYLYSDEFVRLEALLNGVR